MVRAETLKPSLASSAWILRCPQVGSPWSRRIRARNSGAIGRRPVFIVRRERRRQYVRHPWRCQRSTVSGFTMSTEACQLTNHRHARTQKRRSASLRRGRGFRRCRTSSCCRRHRLSAISNTLVRKAAAIAHSKQRNIHPPARCRTRKRFVGRARAHPLRGWQPREGEELLAGLFQAVGKGATLEAPFARNAAPGLEGPYAVDHG
jgi:hypothetical protein